ncbi:suppressor of mec-8 and unc-52 protein homolog 2-like [Spinacia oleracea]|uniref:Suppressor of mec-8 and unc-52 protein homolog 2-like n=1 Tax=Spinacia oleracea TaxID=3562 RepID=A0ABM3RBP6_SPIOL|nr:suppressor of mec-8 and unc-52 protein homolog 2-like [Spinacia oleracea]
MQIIILVLSYCFHVCPKESFVIFRVVKDDQPVSYRTATAKPVYQWIIKPQSVAKTNEMFLPGRMSFIYDMVGCKTLCVD